MGVAACMAKFISMDEYEAECSKTPLAIATSRVAWCNASGLSFVEGNTSWSVSLSRRGKNEEGCSNAKVSLAYLQCAFRSTSIQTLTRARPRCQAPTMMLSTKRGLGGWLHGRQQPPREEECTSFDFYCCRYSEVHRY